MSSLILSSLLSLLWCYIIFSLLFPDALLADLENTSSPLPRCPVLLTSDPPQNVDPTTQDAAQTRPPPPAYTPQQVVNVGHIHTSFLLFFFLDYKELLENQSLNANI